MIDIVFNEFFFNKITAKSKQIIKLKNQEGEWRENGEP